MSQPISDLSQIGIRKFIKHIQPTLLANGASATLVPKSAGSFSFVGRVQFNIESTAYPFTESCLFEIINPCSVPQLASVYSDGGYLTFAKDTSGHFNIYPVIEDDGCSLIIQNISGVDFKYSADIELNRTSIDS